MDWYLLVLKRYAQFDGRARRKEYWYFVLFNALVAILLCALSMAAMMLLSNSNYSSVAVIAFIPYMLYSFAVLIPGLAVLVRRLHDIGKSGWWFFISFIPVVGGIILLVFVCQDSQPGPNIYGPNPKDYAGVPPIVPVIPGY